MIVWPIYFSFYSKYDTEKIIYQLRGITEEEENNFQLIPSSLYKFRGEFTNNKFNIILLWVWKARVTLQGEVFKRSEKTVINLKTKIGIFDIISTFFLYMMFPIIFIIENKKIDVLDLLVFIPFWSIFTIFYIIQIYFTKRHITKIFNKMKPLI